MTMTSAVSRITGAPGLTVAAACRALALALILALAFGAAAPAAAAAAASGATDHGSDLDSILRGLARPAPSSTPFIEARFSPLLSRPIVVSGELQYLGPGSLVRMVEQPHRERAEIHGEAVTVRRGDAPPQHFTLDQVPQMRSLVASFSALLAGDVATLRSVFALDLHGAPSDWTVGLTPLDPRVNASIRSILVTGSLDEPRCLTTFQANDDVDFMLLASAARSSVPVQPDRSWFEARCRGTQIARKE
jgi:Outer membrane lipoprotein carrier protein LolA-like